MSVVATKALCVVLPAQPQSATSLTRQEDFRRALTWKTQQADVLRDSDQWITTDAVLDTPALFRLWTYYEAQIRSNLSLLPTFPR